MKVKMRFGFCLSEEVVEQLNFTNFWELVRDFVDWEPWMSMAAFQYVKKAACTAPKKVLVSKTCTSQEEANEWMQQLVKKLQYNQKFLPYYLAECEIDKGPLLTDILNIDLRKEIEYYSKR